MSDCLVDVTVVDGSWRSIDRSVDLVNVLAFFDKVEYVGGIHVEIGRAHV